MQLACSLFPLLPPKSDHTHLKPTSSLHLSRISNPKNAGSRDTINEHDAMHYQHVSQTATTDFFRSKTHFKELGKHMIEFRTFRHTPNELHKHNSSSAASQERKHDTNIFSPREEDLFCAKDLSFPLSNCEILCYTWRYSTRTNGSSPAHDSSNLNLIGLSHLNHP